MCLVFSSQAPGVAVPHATWQQRGFDLCQDDPVESGTSIEVVVDSRSSFVQKFPVSWPFSQFSNNFSEMASASLS